MRPARASERVQSALPPRAITRETGALRTFSFPRVVGNQAFLELVGRTSRNEKARTGEESEEVVAPELDDDSESPEVDTPADEPEAPASDEPAAALSDFLVDDDVDEVGPGQMKKSEFLDALRSAVCAAVDEALAGTGLTSEGCPHVEYWFGRLAGKSASFVERGIRLYAPGATDAGSAANYIPAVVDRVRQSTEIWARTGRVEGVPEAFAGLGDGEAPPTDAEEAASETGERVHRKARSANAALPAEPSDIQARLGEGRPLDAGVRTRMESIFGARFGAVRLHDDSRAAALSAGLDAHAFAVGDHIAFGPGEYRPGTMVGDALIAHELAHVVQQHGAPGSDGPAETGERGDAPLERDANRVAAGAMASLWTGATGSLSRLGQNALPRLRAGLRLQRCGKSEPNPAAKLTFNPNVLPSETKECGKFFYGAQWVIRNVNSSTDGWIVQKVEVTRDVKDCSNNPVPFSGKGVDPSWYPLWEAWQVRSGTIYAGRTSKVHQFDNFVSESQGDNTKGSIAIKGTADYYDGLSLPSSFSATNASPTWTLEATKTDPKLSGGSGVVDHSATATWDCCTPNKSTKLTTTSPP